MLKVVLTNRFKRDLKRMERRGKDIDKVNEVVDKLSNEEPLEPRHKDHALTGNWKDHRDCHIEPDWVLIYKVARKKLYLIKTGSHSDLFP